MKQPDLNVQTLERLQHHAAALNVSADDLLNRWLDASGASTPPPGEATAQPTTGLQSDYALAMRALEASASTIVITDRSGIIQWANPAFTVLTGYALAEAIGQNPSKLVKSGKHDQAFYRDMWETILAGRVWFGKVINRRKDGQLYTEELTINPVLDGSGEITHFIAVKQDITEREYAEQLMLERERLTASLKREVEYNATVKSVVDSLAHDIRTPLAVITTAKDMLSRYYDRMNEERRREKLETISKQLHYVAELLNDVTLITNTSLNHRRFQPEPVNLALLCQLTVQDLQESSGAAHQMRFTSDGTVTLAYVDSVLVSRILLNLLSNAIKYSPKGSRIDLLLSSADGWIQLRVRDEGIGISPGDQAQIFEPFYRAEAAQAVGGTGLGLSIVRTCLEHHQGRVRVESQVKIGTTFTVELPLLTPANSALQAYNEA